MHVCMIARMHVCIHACMYVCMYVFVLKLNITYICVYTAFIWCIRLFILDSMDLFVEMKPREAMMKRPYRRAGDTNSRLGGEVLVGVGRSVM